MGKVVEHERPGDDERSPGAESDPVHKPFVPASKWLPEFTPRAVLVGSVLGIIFGAASMYVSLKTGLTVSASIPIAVMSISIFRAFARWVARRFSKTIFPKQPVPLV